MGEFQRTTNVTRDGECILEGKLALTFKPLAKVFSLDVRHDVVEVRAHRPRVEQREYVRVLEAGGELDLAEEALRAQNHGEVRSEQLERDWTVVLEIARQPD